MVKEYRRRHGRSRSKRRKHKKRSARKKKRKKRAKRHVSESVPGFRKRRRFAAQPLRGPAEVLHQTKTEYQMLGELARQLLGPRYPPPNKLTQQGPPFLPYDPWAHQRRLIQDDEKMRIAMRREARREARQEARRDAPIGDEYAELGR